ncbi:MAG: RNA methyltransferase [Flavobacteriaceae bacterium]|nr:RNA methyltransferase [Flavobacteriaceae bacterium]
MLSKSQIKLITSLQQKKYRDNSGFFVAEGPKIINELIDANFEIHNLFAIEGTTLNSSSVEIISKNELKKISFLKNANSSLAVFNIPNQKSISEKGIIVALDAIRDPGNLGTIIRLCDWFGVNQIICSQDTVDCYNPKVIQATMGSISRVNVVYTNLLESIKNASLPVFGGTMNGENIYTKELPQDAIIVVGNEGKGISEEIINLLTNRITIPKFGSLQKTESLNVAMATSILLSEFKRSTEK